jgi:hypothetical protein
MAGTFEHVSVTIATHAVSERRWTVFEFRFAPSGHLEPLSQLLLNLPYRDAIGDVALANHPRVELFPSPQKPAPEPQGLACQAEWRDKVLTVVTPVALPPAPTGALHTLWVYTDRDDYYFPYLVHVGAATISPDRSIAHIGACRLERADARLSLKHLALTPDTVAAPSALSLTMSTSEVLTSGSQIRITLEPEPGTEPAADPSRALRPSGPLQLSGDLPAGTNVLAAGNDLVLTLSQSTVGGTDLSFQISGLVNPAVSRSFRCAVRVFSGTVLLGEALTWDGKYGPPIEVHVLPPPLEGVRLVVADNPDGRTTSVSVSFRSPVPIPASAGIAFLMINDNQGDNPLTVVGQNFAAAAEAALKRPRDPIHGKTSVRAVLKPSTDLPAGQPLEFTVSGLVLKRWHEQGEVGVPREVARELANKIEGREREAVILVSTEIDKAVETLLTGPLRPDPRCLTRPAVFEVPAPR